MGFSEIITKLCLAEWILHNTSLLSSMFLGIGRFRNTMNRPKFKLGFFSQQKIEQIQMEGER